jgi:hypothetical protein
VSSSSCCCCSLIDGGKGADGEVGIEGMGSGDVVVTFVISFIIVVMLLSIIGDSCCCCTSSKVDVVLAELFVGVVVPATPITFTL